MKLQIQRTPSGQYRYRLASDSQSNDWEFGPFDLNETIQQALERYQGYPVEILP
jgi:hypothetical protein